MQVYDADPKKTGGSLLNHEIKFYSVDLTDMPEIGHIAIVTILFDCENNEGY